MNNQIFGRTNKNGNVDVLHAKDGAAVTKMDFDVYPVGSSLSARYEHANGIELSMFDAIAINLDLED